MRPDAQAPEDSDKTNMPIYSGGLRPKRSASGPYRVWPSAEAHDEHGQRELDCAFGRLEIGFQRRQRRQIHIDAQRSEAVNTPSSTTISSRRRRSSDARMGKQLPMRLRYSLHVPCRLHGMSVSAAQALGGELHCFCSRPPRAWRRGCGPGSRRARRYPRYSGTPRQSDSW